MNIRSGSMQAQFKLTANARCNASGTWSPTKVVLQLGTTSSSPVNISQLGSWLLQLQYPASDLLRKRVLRSQNSHIMYLDHEDTIALDDRKVINFPFLNAPFLFSLSLIIKYLNWLLVDFWIHLLPFNWSILYNERPRLSLMRLDQCSSYSGGPMYYKLSLGRI